MKQKTLFIAAIVALLCVFIAGVAVYTAKKPESAPPMSAEKLAALGRMHSPVIGKFDAPVVIVEFLDPACGTCADFYPRVKAIMAANPDRIRLVLRYAPFHQGADKVVALLEATRKQGKFWQSLETLLATQDAWAPNHTAQVALAWKQLEGLGLDMEKLSIDMTAPEVARVVSQDIEDAKTLGVRATPEYFVNGRPLPEFGFEQLQQLINEALNAAPQR